MLVKIILNFFLLFAFLGSYQAHATLSASVEKELKTSVKARWETIVEHKFGEAYLYETPTYRAVFTKDLYVNQFSHGVDWNLTKIADIKYDRATNVATVVVVVETKPKNSKGLDVKANNASVEIREKWLHIKGRWWHSSSE